MKTKFLTLLLALVASVGTIFAESGTCGNNLTWNLTNGTLTISGTGTMTNWTYDSLAPWFEYRKSITNLTIGNSVTNIGEGAFVAAGLTNIDIPNSVTSIGSAAFYWCSSLMSVTIPNSVTSIGDNAFALCSGLTSIVVEGGNTIYDSRGNCNAIIETATNTLLVGCKNTIIPDDVTSIGDNAFALCSGLTSVAIPNSVTSIGSSAFFGCSGLTSVVLEAQIPPTKEGNIFDYCENLSFIYVPCGTLNAYKQSWSDYADIIKYPSLEYTITGKVNNTEMGTVIVPTTICDAPLTAIPNDYYHFVQWSDGVKDNPRTIELTQDTTFTAEFAVDKSGTCGDNLALKWEYDNNGNVLTISGKGSLNSNYTFGIEAPTAVEKLIIAEGVTTIGNSAFAGYTTLKHLTISASVKTIYEQAFYNCTGLQEIYNYRDKPSTAYSNTFDGIEKFDCVLHVLSASVDMYKAATGWRDFYYVEPIDAETITEPVEDVVVTPTDNTAEITWPAVDNSNTYEITITKNGEVICTLIFNANGQLAGIAFAPSRNNANKQHTEGFKFTVTGLSSNTSYNYSVVAKDNTDKAIDTKSGSFKTTGSATALDQISQQPIANSQKLFKDGQLFILRGDRTYTVTGQEVK